MSVPSTMLPGQSRDSLWEDIVGRNWEAHVNRFGIGWDTRKTSDAERAAQLARMQREYNKRQAEQQAAQQRAAQQAAQQRAAQQAAQQRAAEQAAQQRAAEQRAAEQRAAEQRLAEERETAQRQAAERPLPGAQPVVAPSPLPEARPAFSQGPFDVTSSPHALLGQGIAASPNIGGVFGDAVQRAEQYFGALQPAMPLVDPAAAAVAPPMQMQGLQDPQSTLVPLPGLLPEQNVAGPSATLAPLPGLLPEQDRQLFAGGGAANMTLPYNNHQLPQTPVGPRITGPVLGPGTDTSDNIPAALSPNEFVFTARAVRNAGAGDIERGIQAMYNLMHRLEQSA